MQVRENWTWLTCRLDGVRDSGHQTDLEVLLESTSEEPGMPDLIAQFRGNHILIRLPGPLANPPPSRFVIKARLAGPGRIWGDAGTIRQAG